MSKNSDIDFFFKIYILLNFRIGHCKLPVNRHYTQSVNIMVKTFSRIYKLHVIDNFKQQKI